MPCSQTERGKMTEEPDNKPPSAQIDWSTDSVRLLTNDERIKCMVIMDVTDLTEDQRHDFVNRALVALTRMGQKLMERRERN